MSEPLPDDVDYTVLLFEDAGGTILSTTGLVLREAGEPIGVELPDTIEEAALVHLLGYRASDLSDRGFADQHAGTELFVATPAEPVLPPPSWYGISRLSSGRGTLERASDPPFLTAPWLAPCSSVVPGESRLAASDCQPAFCSLIAEQSGCAVAIRTGDPSCEPIELQGRIDGRGQVAVDGCAPSEPRSGASAAIECSGLRPFECRIEIYPQAAEPQLSALSVDLFPATAPPPDDPHPVVIGGYLFGLEVFDDRIVVASDGGRAAWSNECPTAQPGVFHFLDPETLGEIGSAPSPPCVRDLVRVPGREELYAVFGAEDARRLGRFSKDGTMLEDVAIPERVGVDYPSSILVHRLSDRVSISFDGNETGQYFVFRRTPLGWEWSSEILKDFALHQEREANIISILQRRQDEIHLFDVTRPYADMRSPFYPTNAGLPVRFRESCEDIQVRAEEMLFVPGEGWLLGSRDATTGALVKLSIDGSDCDIVRWFEGPAEIYDYMIWPANPNLVLSGVRRTDDGTARLALMNRSEERFLTGSIDVGFGAIDDMRADASGRVFMTLPWSARVVRVEMR